VGGRLKQINLDELKQIKDAGGLEKLKRAADDARSAMAELDGIRKDFDEKQKRLNSDFAGIASDMKKIDERGTGTTRRCPAGCSCAGSTAKA